LLLLRLLSVLLLLRLLSVLLLLRLLSVLLLLRLLSVLLLLRLLSMLLLLRLLSMLLFGLALLLSLWVVLRLNGRQQSHKQENRGRSGCYQEFHGKLTPVVVCCVHVGSQAAGTRDRIHAVTLCAEHPRVFRAP